MRNLYTSVDLGSDSIKVLVGEVIDNKLKVLATSEVKSSGIKKGLIYDATDTINSIKLAIGNIEDKLMINVNKIIVSVPAYYSNYDIINGEIDIDNEDSKIGGKEVIKVLQSAIKSVDITGKELVSIVPIHFLLDNKKKVLDPKRLMAKKLSVKAMMITVPSKTVQSVISVFQTLGIEVIDINLGPIADYCEFKNALTDKGVTAIINIGYDITTVSLFNKGIIVNSEIIQIGGKNIDNDISYVFKISSEDSRMLKEKFALAHKRLSKVNEVYDITTINKTEISITQYDITQVVMSRLSEILKIAKKQTFLLTNREISYIIITGGTSETSGMVHLVDEIFGVNTKVGNIETIGIRNNKFSTVSGLIKGFENKLELRDKEYSMIGTNETEELSSQRRKINYGDSSLIGKIFGYFFDE